MLLWVRVVLDKIRFCGQAHDIAPTSKKAQPSSVTNPTAEERWGLGGEAKKVNWK